MLETFGPSIGGLCGGAGIQLAVFILLMENVTVAMNHGRRLSVELYKLCGPPQALNSSSKTTHVKVRPKLFVLLHSLCISINHSDEPHPQLLLNPGC